MKKVVHHIKKMKLKALYIATDNDPMLKEFKKALKSVKVCLLLIFIIEFLFPVKISINAIALRREKSIYLHFVSTRSVGVMF